MHRMCRLVVPASVVLSFAALIGSPASASSLIEKAKQSQTFPDVSADVTGGLKYTYDPTSQTGQFQVHNTPYLIAGRADTGSEYWITGSPGADREQLINLTLDQSGQLVTGASSNSYQLYGNVNADGHQFNGLLLQGTPTAFESYHPSDPNGLDTFYVGFHVTGGALAPYFGANAYVLLYPELNSTFQGRFDQSFSIEKARSNTRSEFSPQPFPIPEPTTLVVFLCGGLGLAYRQRRRLAR